VILCCKKIEKENLANINLSFQKSERPQQALKATTMLLLHHGMAFYLYCTMLNCHLLNSDDRRKLFCLVDDLNLSLHTPGLHLNRSAIMPGRSQNGCFDGRTAGTVPYAQLDRYDCNEIFSELVQPEKISIWRDSVLANNVENHQLMDHAFNIWSRTFDIYFPRLVP